MNRDMYDVFENIDIPYEQLPNNYGQYTEESKYDPGRRNIKIKWYYGDSITLTFYLKDIDGDTTQAEFDSKVIDVMFYDFQFNVVHSVQFTPNNNGSSIFLEDGKFYVRVKIDSEVSLKFKKGIYHCGIVMTDVETATSPATEPYDVSTVLSAEDSTIYVE